MRARRKPTASAQMWKRNASQTRGLGPALACFPRGDTDILSRRFVPWQKTTQRVGRWALKLLHLIKQQREMI